VQFINKCVYADSHIVTSCPWTVSVACLAAPRHLFRDWTETEPSKNEPNQYPGFAKNRTEPEPGAGLP